jgi:hypothetical protein
MDDKTIVLDRTKEKDEGGGGGGGGSSGEEEWQKGGEKGPDNPESKLQKLSRIEMTEKRVQMTTFKDDKPHLLLELDETSQLISMATLDEGRPRLEFTLDGQSGNLDIIDHERDQRPGLVFELQDEHRRIVLMTTRGGQPQLRIELDGQNDRLSIATNGKTEQIFDNSNGRITVHAEDRVILGDRSGSEEAAKRDSIDSMGNRLIGDLAQKVFVK